MGLFLHLSTIISTPKVKTIKALKDIFDDEESPLESVSNMDNEDELFIINHSNKNSNILFPAFYEHWELSKNISKSLKTSVLTLEIHDGDFWYFILYDNGKEIIKFNPCPEYYEENIDDSEINSWLPNVDTFCKYFPSINLKDIENYFINWKANGINHWTDKSNLRKAYPTDNYEYGNGLQLFDFIDKLGIEYPINKNGDIKGDKFKIKEVRKDESQPNPYDTAKQVIKQSHRYHSKYISITEEEFQFLTGQNYVNHLAGFSDTLFCPSCRERHPAVKIQSRILSDYLEAELYGQCTKCGGESGQLVSLFDAQKIIKLFE